MTTADDRIMLHLDDWQAALAPAPGGFFYTPLAFTLAPVKTSSFIFLNRMGLLAVRDGYYGQRATLCARTVQQDLLRRRKSLALNLHCLYRRGSTPDIGGAMMKGFEEFTDDDSQLADDYVPFSLMAVVYYLGVSLFLVLTGVMNPGLSRIEMSINNALQGTYQSMSLNPWLDVGGATLLALLISACMIYHYETRTRRRMMRTAQKPVSRIKGAGSHRDTGRSVKPMAARRNPLLIPGRAHQPHRDEEPGTK
jgi:hypothetical protein